jgi:Protein of unknown function (DUF642)
MRIYRNFLAGAGAIALAIYAGSALAGAVTVVNGSFEDGNYNQQMANAYYDTLPAGDSSLAGWSIGMGGVDWIDSSYIPASSTWPSSHGTKNLDMNANAAGSISQAIVGLVAGQQYLLTFDYAAFPSTTFVVKTLQATLGDFTTIVQAVNNPNQGWLTYSALFTFTGSNVLSFKSLNAGARGPLLDNVGISTLSAVPVPPAFMLLLTGLAGIGALGRKRRRRSSAA